MYRPATLPATLLAVFVVIPVVVGLVSYDNDFVDPNYIIAKSFDVTTAASQQTIVDWADELAAQGPWSVTNKTVLPPSGDIHDYMSWAPYSWPNCTGVGNTTELTPQQIWVTCPYYTRDGMFNPDGRLVNDTGHFQAMSDAILYNAISWVITGSSSYSTNVASFVNTWFINPSTAMNPNLNYSQMARGPEGQVGTHTGVLDLKGMTKITSAILILRLGNSTDWTSELDGKMTNWTSLYINWLQTSPLARQEQASTNNHGSFFYNQMTANQILVGNTTGAQNSINMYFDGIYMNQIDANGEQPLEAVRTRPYHYRSYNLAAMITNARLGDHLGLPSFWNKTTTKGGTIKAALDFALTVQPGDEQANELYPDIAAVAATYGDANGTYAAFLANADNTYPAQPYYCWDQPLSDSNLAAATPTSGGPSIPTSKTGGARISSRTSSIAFWTMLSFAVAFLTI